MPKTKDWTWEEDGVKVVRSVARSGPGCHEGCGVLLYVKDGKLLKVEGDPEFPANQGRLCPRCLALTQVVYNPDRLKYPLKRAGKKGEDKWERITWEEAFDTIAERLTEIKKKYGAESVIFCSGTARDIPAYCRRLAFTYGSPNRVAPMHGAACFVPKLTLERAMFGDYAVADCAQFFSDRYENPNWRVPKCIFIWGNEPLAANSDGFMGHWIIECMKRGTELIVADPRRTWVASHAKVWLQVRPGTDSALSLGLLNVIINERLYDEEFVQKWTYGFDELKKRVQEYPPERVAEITWVPKEKIIEAARLYAKSKPASIQWGVSLDQTRECIPTLQGVINLWTITGNMDVPGGNIINGRNFGLDRLLHWGHEAIFEEQKKKLLELGKYPFLDRLELYSALTWQGVVDTMYSGIPYPIKGAWIQGHNTFANGTADVKRVHDGLQKLDFVVVVDLFMTPTAMACADIVLPAATYAERDGIAIQGGFGTYVSTINKAIEPVGECKFDMEINLEVGRRINPEAWPWNNIYEMFDVMLEPTGMTWEELRDRGVSYDTFEYRKHEKGVLRPDKKPGFNTRTGKVELYSPVLEECGLDALPYFEEPPASPTNPEYAEEYPLVLIAGARSWGFFHSEHRQIPRLRQLNPDPVTEIHPETAKKLGIKDGDWVYIESKYGRCKQKAKVTMGIHPRFIHAQHGWWFPEKPAAEPSLYGVWESNINLLLPPGWTGKSGFGYPYKTQMCRVYKTEED